MNDRQRKALIALLDAQQRYTLALAQCHACGADQLDLSTVDTDDIELLSDLNVSDFALEYQLSLIPR